MLHLLQLHLTVHVPEQNQRSSVDQTKPVKSRKQSQQLLWSSENNFGHSRKLFEIQRRAVCSLSRPWRVGVQQRTCHRQSLSRGFDQVRAQQGKPLYKKAPSLFGCWSNSFWPPTRPHPLHPRGSFFCPKPFVQMFDPLKTHDQKEACQKLYAQAFNPPPPNGQF